MQPFNMDFDILQKIFIKTVEQCIKNKYFKKSNWVSVSGIASQFSNDFVGFEREERQRVEISQMLATMEKYYPDLFQNFLKER